ncbi:MAG TPA: mannitol dehydrogenase family protein [Steroidobacteraceae bacterium]|nr:mannitol dehydrogenase family protein [Steroidobacteraceae bacterium]
MSRRLGRSTLDCLSPDVARPGYDWRAVQTGVVHLGIGAFHRAHQAVYFDEALRRGDLRWGVAGVSLRSTRVRDELVPQDGLYSVLVREGDSVRARIIGAVRAVLVAPQDPPRVVRLLAQPQVHVVTLTVTEKGYKLDPASGDLLREDGDVAADLRDLGTPRSVPGFIVAGLGARRRAGLAPFTLISCDNLPHNGRRLRGAVLALARAHDPSLADWICDEGAFPDTVVDRIVPAPTAESRAQASQRLGLEDRASVSTEPFRQWVIEQRFAGPVPDLAALGVDLTADVEPWEQAKLRLLNGAHSAMAYIGGLAGVEFVHDLVALPEGAAFIEALWNESAQTLCAPRALDVAGYRAALLARFRNGALRHRLRQIAMDGSQKLPQRLLAPLAAQRASRRPAAMLTLAVAAWMRWQRGVDDRGASFAVDDPLAPQTKRCLAGCADAAARVQALLGLEAVFGADIRGDGGLRQALSCKLERIETMGALGALREALAQRG